MAKAGVVLAGCGVLDGTEIHEAVCTMLALSQTGVEVEFFAPDIPQDRVANHAEGAELTGEVRNVLIESARIARGSIRDIATASADAIDMLIFPGGHGAISNLSTFADDGPDCKVNGHVSRLILQMHTLSKPVGAICISPVLIARVLGQHGATCQVTIGNDEITAQAVEAMGATHIPCEVDQCLVDAANKVVTTPAYMLADSVDQVFAGISKLVAEVLALA